MMADQGKFRTSREFFSRSPRGQFTIVLQRASSVPPERAAMLVFPRATARSAVASSRAAASFGGLPGRRGVMKIWRRLLGRSRVRKDDCVRTSTGSAYNSRLAGGTAILCLMPERSVASWRSCVVICSAVYGFEENCIAR